MHLCPFLFFDLLIWCWARRYPILLHQRWSPFSPWDLRRIHEEFLRSLLFRAMSVFTSSLSRTSACLRTSLLTLGSTTLCTLNELCQLTHGHQCSRIMHRDEGRQGIRKSVLTVFSSAFRFFTEVVNFLSTFVTSSNALAMLSHTPSGGPYTGQNACSFAVFPHCNVGSLSGLLQSYGFPHTPHHQPLKLFILRLSP